MKITINDLAILGGAPALTKPVTTGQYNLPDWEKVESMLLGIFRRQYYANHGPLVRQLDQRIAKYVGIKHAICVTNEVIGLMVLVKGMELSGEIILPASTPIETVEACMWAGLKPILCDIDPKTHTFQSDSIARLITSNTSAILGLHPRGKVIEPEILSKLAAEHQIKLIYDAASNIGCFHAEKHIGRFGQASVFSFHESGILNGAEGGCIVTDDDELADRLKTIRNFHPSETFADVPLRINGKMSEAQAGLALLSLEDIEANITENRKRYHAYSDGLKNIPGINLMKYSKQNKNDYSKIIIEVNQQTFGLNCDLLYNLLAFENIACLRPFYSGPYLNKKSKDGSSAFPNTKYLSQLLLQLPNNQHMKMGEVDSICNLIHSIYSLSGEYMEYTKNHGRENA